jgi:hypothetical protein
MIKFTQHQLGALFQVYLNWQNITPHPIMPESFEVVSVEEYGVSDYYGLWVGTPINDNPGSLYIGIEGDGHTHS